ncbi:MAG: helix-turn-helix domain-containing protein [Gemmatimonadota bacterium]
MNIESGLKIGALARLAGTTAPTIRYYEQIGLLPRPVRPAGHQRRYDTADVQRLTFIRRCRDFDFSIDHVRELVSLLGDPSSDCKAVQDIGQSQLDIVRAKLLELRSLEKMLAEFVDRCAKSCTGGPSSRCRPLAKLARSGPVKPTRRDPRHESLVPSQSRHTKR